jgi:hypothetical protein
LSQIQPIPKGKIVDFKPLREDWSDYSLSDGTVLRVKVVISKVTRLQNPDGNFSVSPTGEPIYFFQSQNVVQVVTPAEYTQITKGDLSE